MSLADQKLAGGITVLNAEHGEPVLILDGKDAGKTFMGRVEDIEDLVIDGEVVKDRRARKTVYFDNGQPLPCIGSQDKLQTSDGRKWKATINPQSAYLETDYTLVEWTGKDS